MFLILNEIDHKISGLNAQARKCKKQTIGQLLECEHNSWHCAECKWGTTKMVMNIPEPRK
jgi:hypothetical protein